MRVLLEHVMDEELPSIAKKLEGYCWRVLPPDLILYKPCSKLEDIPEVPNPLCRECNFLIGCVNAKRGNNVCRTFTPPRTPDPRVLSGARDILARKVAGVGGPRKA